MLDKISLVILLATPFLICLGSGVVERRELANQPSFPQGTTTPYWTLTRTFISFIQLAAMEYVLLVASDVAVGTRLTLMRYGWDGALGLTNTLLLVACVTTLMASFESDGHIPVLSVTSKLVMLALVSAALYSLL